jgi:hypothetical protein
MSRQPPALALWLLKQLGRASGNAPLVGDLLEEFDNGRSASWFWRQTMTAIATCAGRRVALLQTYWIGTALGFAAQLPVSLLLFRLGLPHAASGFGWKIAAFLLLIICMILIWVLSRWAFGKSSNGVKSTLLATGASTAQRPALICAAAFDPFVSTPLLYCFCCVLFSPAAFYSSGVLVLSEFVWLGAGEIATEFSSLFFQVLKSRRAEKEQAWEARAWPRLNELEVSLVSSDGAKFVLHSGACMETIFASANEELITALCKGGTSFEQIRRAIWLSGAAEFGWPRRNTKSRFTPVAVKKFARLLGAGTESERTAHYVTIGQ